MNKTLTGAAAALALIALPVAGATAKPGSGNGNGNGNGHGNAQSAPGVADGRGETAAPRRCRRMESVGFTAVGTLATFTPEDVTLEVVKANKHARSYIASAGSTFTLGSARVKFEGVTDGDGNGTVDLGDVLPTDRVKAIGKATRPKRGCEGESVLTLRKLQIVRPEAEAGEVADES